MKWETFSFANPWLLLLLLALPLLAILRGARGAAPAVVYSSLAPLRSLGAPRRAKAGGWLLTLLLLQMMLREAYRHLLAGVPEDQVEAVVMATHVLSGASSWSHLRDYCGLDGVEGGKVAALAIELIVEATKARANAARDCPPQGKKPPRGRGWITHRLAQL